MEIWPLELRIKDNGRQFEMLLENQDRLIISAELLRVESPSAEVKGHGPGQETLVWGKRNVLIMRAEAVGNYAVRLHFNDGHNTGLFTWRYLAELAHDHEAKMQAYVEKLAAAGLSR